MGGHTRCPRRSHTDARGPANGRGPSRFEPRFRCRRQHGLPVNLLCWGILDKGLPHIQRHRDTVIVIDHLGLLQPARPPVPADVRADLPKLLALAQYENVRVKISGACTMSHQPFPYDDIWEPVLRVIDAFGLDRCMWGTDWTRTIGMLTYGRVWRRSATPNACPRATRRR